VDIYKSKKVLITGGLGFLGSNLAIRLVNGGAIVTIIDSLDERYGGNLFNVESIKDRIKIVIADVCDEEKMEPLVQESDIIFHFAAQVSYIDSLSNPLEDQQKSATSTLLILELARKLDRKPLIVFSSSRMVLGVVSNGVVSETAKPDPLSMYGIHKLLSERYLQLYYKEFGIPFMILRITNPYGIRQQVKHNKYSLVGWFIRMAMDGETIEIFGDGKQKRDYIFSEDISNGFYLIGCNGKAVGRIINIGSGICSEFREMVSNVIETVGNGRMEFIPWPEHYERIETGDAVADISTLVKLTGYKPKYSLKEGIYKTYEYYKQNLDYYI
jgi:nucleoside-diphosphate-sugar epimerase